MTQLDVNYKIKLANINSHIIDIKLTIDNPDKKGQKLSLPAWLPGSYLVRDFSKHIVAITARDKKTSKDIAISTLDKNLWQLAPTNNSIVVDYQIYAYIKSVRSAYLDANRAFFNGANILLQVHKKEQLVHLLEILPQENWSIATTLTKYTQKPNTVIYQAANYQDLLDTPVEVSNFISCDFVVNNITHKIAISGKHKANTQRLVDDVKKILSYQQNFFASSPFSEYLFLLLATNDGYGGLEHKNSSSLICKRDDLPSIYTQGITPEYSRLLTLFSHEYFHAWWIKRLKPQEFLQLDFTKENYTKQLWIFEGWTSYYDELFLLRAKLLSPQQYLSLFSQTVIKVVTSSAIDKQNLCDASFYTWTKFYQQDENARNSVVSYYTKGALLAFVLDVKIRKLSNDKLSLDDVVRELYKRYQFIGLKDNSVNELVSEMLEVDCSSFFAKFVDGCDELPLKESFAFVGIDYKLIAKIPQASFNCNFKKQQGFAVVENVFDNTSAQNYGLCVGDMLVAIDDIKINYDELDKTLARYPSGVNVSLSVFRDGVLINFVIVTQQKNIDTCELSIAKNLSVKTKKRQQQWFYQK